MNKQGPSGISWTDYTWNPITGCLNGCKYCYARKMYHRYKWDFTPKIHYDRLGEPLYAKKPSRIFVCSVSDFWGKEIKQMWRNEVYNTIKAYPEHTFILLTKQPQNLTDTDIDWMPDNVWVGVSCEGEKDCWRVETLASYPLDNIKFVSLEPLLEEVKSIPFLLVDWIILGGLTPKPVHKKEWVDNILKDIKKPIFMKNNLKYQGKIRQEFPSKE